MHCNRFSPRKSISVLFLEFVNLGFTCIKRSGNADQNQETSENTDIRKRSDSHGVKGNNAVRSDTSRRSVRVGVRQSVH